MHWTHEGTHEVKAQLNTDQSKQTVDHVTVTSRTEPRWYVKDRTYHLALVKVFYKRTYVNFSPIINLQYVSG